MKFCYMTFTLEIRRILERKSLPTKNDKLFFVTLPPHFTAKKNNLSKLRVSGRTFFVSVPLEAAVFKMALLVTNTADSCVNSTENAKALKETKSVRLHHIFSFVKILLGLTFFGKFGAAFYKSKDYRKCICVFLTGVRRVP